MLHSGIGIDPSQEDEYSPKTKSVRGRNALPDDKSPNVSDLAKGFQETHLCSRTGALSEAGGGVKVPPGGFWRGGPESFAEEGASIALDFELPRILETAGLSDAIGRRSGWRDLRSETPEPAPPPRLAKCRPRSAPPRA